MRGGEDRRSILPYYPIHIAVFPSFTSLSLSFYISFLMYGFLCFLLQSVLATCRPLYGPFRPFLARRADLRISGIHLFSFMLFFVSYFPSLRIFDFLKFVPPILVPFRITFMVLSAFGQLLPFAPRALSVHI